MEEHSQYDGLLSQWQELKAEADALIGQHILAELSTQPDEQRLKEKALKALRRINKARKAERRAWDVFSDYVEAELASADA